MFFFIFLFDVRKNSFNFVKPYKYVKKNTENKHFSCIKTLFCGIASPVLHSLAWLPNRLHTLYLYAITYVISYWFSVSVYTAKNVSIPPSETPPQSMGDPRAGARLLYDSYKWRPPGGECAGFHYVGRKNRCDFDKNVVNSITRDALTYEIPAIS